MSRAEQKQEAGRFLEFRNLEELAEYIGLYYPEEIHVFAAVEHWYTEDDQQHHQPGNPVQHRPRGQSAAIHRRGDQSRSSGRPANLA